MSDKRVALLLDIGFGTLHGSERSTARIDAYLAARGFERIVLRGPEVTRDRVRDELKALRGRLEEGDAFVLYFVGHGEKILADGATASTVGPRAAAAVMLLITHDLHLGTALPGIAGAELLEWLGPVASATGNVTVILDCCHAATMAAGSSAPDDAARARIDEVLAREAAMLRKKYGVVDPRGGADERAIVRLVATTQNDYAVERLTDDRTGRIGLFTDSLVHVLERHESLPWDDLLLELQARVQQDCPSQRPGVEGPRYRIPFTRREQLPLDEYLCIAENRGWTLHAGALHGVDAGDRFDLGGAPAEVVDVSADRARLRVDGAEPPPLLRARRIACARRDAVTWLADHDPPDILVRALADAPELVFAGPGDAVASLTADGAGVAVRDAAGELVHVEPSLDAPAVARILHAVRRIARWRRQSALLEQLAAGPPPLQIAWGIDGQDALLPPSGAELPEGSRLWLRAWRDGPPPLYVSLFHRRADRTIEHLTADLDHGVVVARRSIDLTQTPAGEPRRIQLSWGDRVPRDGPREEALFLLASAEARSLHRVATDPLVQAHKASRGGPANLPPPAAVRLRFRLLPRARASARDEA